MNPPACQGKTAGSGFFKQTTDNSTNPESCSRFRKCCAPICPLDRNWRARTHLRDEPVCFYLREYSKIGSRLKFRGGLAGQTQCTLIMAYHAIIHTFYDINKQLKRSAKTGSRLGSLPGATKKYAA